MSMPTDREQRELLQWEDEKNKTRITDRMKHMLSEAEQRILQQMADQQRRLDAHDGFIDKLRRNLMGIVKG